jgi:Raf kinase inhibitor-like YbhB/YbcL family protein
MLRTFVAVCLFSLAGASAARAEGFKLSSPDFKEGGTIKQPNVGTGMGCTGENLSPALEWKNPPAGTKSFVLMMRDPDAPTGSGFWHWVVYNIPADATGLPAGAGKPGSTTLPKGAVQSNTDMAAPGYLGPCPPP